MIRTVSKLTSCEFLYIIRRRYEVCNTIRVLYVVTHSICVEINQVSYPTSFCNKLFYSMTILILYEPYYIFMYRSRRHREKIKGFPFRGFSTSLVTSFGPQVPSPFLSVSLINPSTTLLSLPP